MQTSVRPAVFSAKRAPVQTRRTALIVRAQKPETRQVPNPREGTVDSFKKLEEPVRKDAAFPPDGGPPVSQRNENDADANLIELGRAEREAVNSIGIPTQVGLADAMRFKGALPETVNSRLAMLGFVAAVVAEANTGKDVIAQAQSYPVFITATFATIILASIIPVVRGAKRTSNGIWTPEAETLNGRVAMLGFLAIVVSAFVERGGHLWSVSQYFPHN